MKLNKGLTLKQKSGLIGLGFMLPWIIGLLVFTAMPLLYSMWLSVCVVEFDLKGIVTEFVGFQWYKEAFTEDTKFVSYLLQSLKFMGFLTPMILVVSVAFAMLLNKSLPGRGFFRALFFFPVVFINGPVMGKLIWNDATAIIKPDQYAFYQVIATLPEVISTPLLYIFDSIVLILWFSGVQILVVLASLQKMNGSIYEAARVDGASSWQIFWKITLPSLRPMLLVAAVYTIVDLSGYSGNEIIWHIRNNMTVTKKTYAYSSAISWLYSLSVLILLLIAFLILRERRKKSES